MRVLLRGCVVLLGVLLTTAPAFSAEPARGAVTPIDATQFRAALDEQRGQVVLVNFWATWCRPCLKEIPELSALAEKHHSHGLRLVAVSLDEPGDLEGVVKPFLQKWFPDFRTYARLTPSMDDVVSVVDPAWNELLPTSYLIDRAGKVRVRIQGGKLGPEFEAGVGLLLSEPGRPVAVGRQSPSSPRQ